MKTISRSKCSLNNQLIGQEDNAPEICMRKCEWYLRFMLLIVCLICALKICNNSNDDRINLFKSNNNIDTEHFNTILNMGSML
jgi:hypothetical protein